MSDDVPSVTLRPLRPADAGTLAAWGADPGFCRAAGWSERPAGDRLAFFVGLIASPPAGRLRLGADDGGELVGYVDLAGTHRTERELGYVVGPRERWGRGYGLAVARAGVHHGFGVLGLTAVTAEVADGNVASVRILLRLGMTETPRGCDATGLRRLTLTRSTWRAAQSPPGSPGAPPAAD